MKVYNITFGAPYFGNNESRIEANDEGYHDQMLHVVLDSDIVPDLMSLKNTLHALKKDPILSRLTTLAMPISFIEWISKVILTKMFSISDEEAKNFVEMCLD